MTISRIDLERWELENLREILSYAKEYAKMQETELYFSDSLLEKIENPKEIKYSAKKSIAAEKATEERSRRVREKIQKAINLLNLEQKEITPYRVAKISGVSFVTAKKYLKSLNEV